MQTGRRNDRFTRQTEGEGLFIFFIFQGRITGVFCGAWFYWSHWKLCIKSKVGNKKWNWQTFTLICLRMKWFDGSEQWNDTKSGEENNTVKEYFQWHSGDSRHGTGTVGNQCRGGKLILVLRNILDHYFSFPSLVFSVSISKLNCLSVYYLNQ